jgi:hypothetical protein
MRSSALAATFQENAEADRNHVAKATTQTGVPINELVLCARKVCAGEDLGKIKSAHRALLRKGLRHI